MNTGLLEKDPLGAFQQINEMYLKYLQSAFKTRYKQIEDQRMKLLRENGNAYQDPYIEILPEYKENTFGRICEWKFNDFKDCFNTENEFNTFVNLITSGLIPGNIFPYTHQVNMLKEGMSKGRAVVTSGTGSGKTEAFMMPLIGNILKEALSWDKPNPITQKLINQTKNLYSTGVIKDFEYTRSHETRPAAIRAIVLYPMNALVADQMVRLRAALDNDKAREIYKGDHFRGNRIYFGRYNSDALPTGKKLSHYNPNDAEDKRKKTTKIENVSNQLKNYYEQADNNKKILNKIKTSEELQFQIKKDTEFIYPRLSVPNETGDIDVSSEMLTRWDMQEFPPDILITNYSMLNVMLMRRAEEAMFEQTRKWLNCEDEITTYKSKEEKAELKKLRKVHLVIDELHLYRGAAGTEIAYLVRCLYKALGLEPLVDGKPNDQLCILCSSASLGKEDQTKKFLSDFFNLPSNSFTEVKGESKYDDNDYKDCKENLNEIYKELLSGECKPEDLEIDMSQLKKIIYKTLYSTQENRLKPISVLAFSKFLFPAYADDPDDKLLKAIRNILIWRGSNSDNSLPRFRFHGFYKYIEGMWAELPDNILNDAATEDEYNLINDLYFAPQIVGKSNNKVLELLRCEQCNTMFYGGEKTIDNDADGGSIITLGIENTKLENIPNTSGQSLVKNKKYNEYGIFWPFENVAEDVKCGIDAFINNHITPVSWLPHDNNLPPRRASWYKAVLNKKTGQILRGEDAQEDHNLITGFVYTICQNNNPTIINDGEVNHLSAIPDCCPGCGQNFGNRTYTKSPINNFRAGLSQSNQILSKELFYQLKEEYSKEDILLQGRKLVSFTDSREEAASQAFGIEREHFRLLVQELMMNEIENESAKKLAMKTIEELEAIKRDLISANDKDLKQEELTNLYPNFGDEIEIITDFIKNPDNTRKIKRYNALIENLKLSTAVDFIRFKDLIEGAEGESMGPILKQLLQLGINPLGVGKEFENITLIRGNTEQLEPWYKLFDLSSFKLDTNYLLRFEELKFHAAIGEEDTNKENEIAIYADNGWEIKILRFIFKSLKSFLSTQALFKTYVFGIENSGLGYAMFDPQKIDNCLNLMPNNFDNLKTPIARPHIDNLLNSVLRVCGNNFYFADQEFGKAAFASFNYYNNGVDQLNDYLPIQKDAIKGSNNKIIKFFESYAKHNPFNNNNLQYWLDFIFKMLIGTDQQGIRNGLFRVIPQGNINLFNGNGFAQHPTWVINYDNLVIKKVEPNSPIYRNSLTKRVHLFHTHSACENNESGICTFSFTPNVSLSGEKAEELWKTNHISYPFKYLKREPIRLHTAELTGQTDDQITVQNEFKGIVELDESVNDLSSYQAMRKRQEVDIINVTTTMEVGIDIGSLQAIFQGNMPPTRYNYQQRVGRGGRRGQAFSAALTFCRGRSHDLFYYNHGLDKITGDVPTPPAISIYRADSNSDVKSIAKRMIVRTILGDSFKSFDIPYEDLDNKDTHGELGMVSDYKVTNREKLKSWIVDYEAEIKKIITFFISGHDEYFLPYIQTELLTEIDKILFDKDDNIKTNQPSLAQALAEGGMLPMFGMPSVVREFYHSFNLNPKKNNRELYSMSREIELAISEFAPGQVRTKDKAKYISKGLTQVLVGNGGQLQYMFRGMNPLANRITLTEEESAAFNLDPQIPTVVPIAFRTAQLTNNRGDSIDAEDSATNFTKIEIRPRPSDAAGTILEGNINYKKRFNSVDSYPKILKINTNNSQGFRLSQTNADQLNNEYLDRAENGSSYYLGFEKVTNLLGLIPNNNILGLNIINVNPFDQNGKIEWRTAGRNAGIYSAAFILQAIVAEELDIDPSEIEISPIQKYNDGGPFSVPELFLSDKLANGSGFVTFLNNNFEKLLNKLFNKEYKIYESLLTDERALKYFYNQSYHPIIDPLLGLSYLRLFQDEEYKCGAIEGDKMFDEVTAIKSKMEVAGKIFKDTFPGFELKESADEIFYLESGNIKYVITHPFWNTEYQQDENVLFRFGNFGSNVQEGIKYIDYFNLLHRPLFVSNSMI